MNGPKEWLLFSTELDRNQNDYERVIDEETGLEYIFLKECTSLDNVPQGNSIKIDLLILWIDFLKSIHWWLQSRSFLR